MWCIVQNEASLTRSLLKKVQQLYPSSFIWKIRDEVRGGIPDALLLRNRHYLWIEFKRLDEAGKMHHPVSTLQSHTMAQITRAGGTTVVVTFGPTQTAVWDPGGRLIAIDFFDFLKVYWGA